MPNFQFKSGSGCRSADHSQFEPTGAQNQPRLKCKWPHSEYCTCTNVTLATFCSSKLAFVHKFICSDWQKMTRHWEAWKRIPMTLVSKCKLDEEVLYVLFNTVIESTPNNSKAVSSYWMEILTEASVKQSHSFIYIYHGKAFGRKDSLSESLS